MRTCLVPFIISYHIIWKKKSEDHGDPFLRRFRGCESKFSWSGAMELCRHRRGQGGHVACACGEYLLRGTQWRLSAAAKALTRATRRPKRTERMRKHKLGQQGHGLLALDVVDGLHEETLYKDGRSELCCAHLADGMAELPRKKPCFLRCSMTVFEAGSGLRQHPRSRQRTNNEMVSFLQ